MSDGRQIISTSNMGIVAFWVMADQDGQLKLNSLRAAALAFVLDERELGAVLAVAAELETRRPPKATTRRDRL